MSAKTNPFDLAFVDGKPDVSKAPDVARAFDTDVEAMSEGDKFWAQTTHAFFMACICYLLEEKPAEDCTVEILCCLMQMAITNRPEFDALFTAVKTKNPAAQCVTYFNAFTLAPRKTAAAIAASAVAIAIKAT